jgi:hypothetical protein
MTPILELGTTLQLHVIKVDGVEYALVERDALSLRDDNRLRRWGKAITAALDDEADPEAISKGEHALVEALAFICPSLPREISGQFSDMQRLAVVEGFLRVSRDSPLANALAGGTSSPGSSASTAAPSPTGSA